jgi:hypothetical protein
MIGGSVDAAGKAGFKKLIDEALDPERVVLTCGIHNISYSRTMKPNFKCKQCLMVMFMGLLANTAPERRLETVEMLEASIHHLIEADKRGEIDHKKLLARPEIYINDKRIN